MGDFSQIKYLVIDVDGTLTDAGIYYDEHGNELKKFCTKDAAGFLFLQGGNVLRLRNECGKCKWNILCRIVKIKFNT